uniref:KASH domain-containing protein n=1 Tax=Glossina brevipalpis TaxID=37001 RepID=A0A1A9WIJ5_9MUSC
MVMLNTFTTKYKNTTLRHLLAAWEELLSWSENAVTPCKIQKEISDLKSTLNCMCNKSSSELLDTEPDLHIAIENLEKEKVQLQTYRCKMLKLNASAHSWLTKQVKRLDNALDELQLKEAAIKANNNELIEEKEEFEFEQQVMLLEKAQQQQQQQQEQQEHQEQETRLEELQSNDHNTTLTMMVTDSNGNRVESFTTATTTIIPTTTITTASAASSIIAVAKTTTANEKASNLNMLISSEKELHKHLKDEVADMYEAWDHACARISKQLEVLKSSSQTLNQLESGLSEFKKALGQDRSTLKGLEGALKKGQPTADDLENVKLVAKLLSERVNVSQEQLSAVQGYLDSNQILHFTRFTASNGSLSDSGISDGGTTSDGGLSERERHLGFLRRLAKQVEALAPGSEAMKSIAARVEAAEAELKNFQNTCALIVRTVVSQQNKQQQETNSGIKLNGIKVTEKIKQSSQDIDQEKQKSDYLQGSGNGRRNRRGLRCLSNSNSYITQKNGLQGTPGDDDPSDDPSLTYEIDSSDDDQAPKRGWAWRIARVAVPMQLALFTVFCAACLMQPNCCDNINNFSMSFTPQLRYIRGPPPI